MEPQGRGGGNPSGLERRHTARFGSCPGQRRSSRPGAGSGRGTLARQAASVQTQGSTASGVLSEPPGSFPARKEGAPAGCQRHPERLARCPALTASARSPSLHRPGRPPDVPLLSRGAGVLSPCANTTGQGGGLSPLPGLGQRRGSCRAQALPRDRRVVSAESTLLAKG